MDLMQQNNIGKQSATLSFDVQKFVSYDELKMTLALMKIQDYCFGELLLRNIKINIESYAALDFA